MTAKIVNLRQFRKQKAKDEKEKAEQNRLSFGRGKAEKALTAALNEKARKNLDQGKKELSGPDPEGLNPGAGKPENGK